MKELSKNLVVVSQLLLQLFATCYQTFVKLISENNQLEVQIGAILAPTKGLTALVSAV